MPHSLVTHYLLTLSDGEKWLYGLCAAGVFALLTAAANHGLAGRRDRQTARRNAAAAFRSAIIAALDGLYPLPVRWPQDVGVDPELRKIFPALQSAIAQFRPWLPIWRRWALDRAWFRYRCSTGRPIDLQCYHHYMAFSDNPDPKGAFRRNVDALLAFAPAR